MGSHTDRVKLLQQRHAIEERIRQKDAELLKLKPKVEQAKQREPFLIEEIPRLQEQILGEERDLLYLGSLENLHLIDFLENGKSIPQCSVSADDVYRAQERVEGLKQNLRQLLKTHSRILELKKHYAELERSKKDDEELRDALAKDLQEMSSKVTSGQKKGQRTRKLQLTRHDEVMKRVIQIRTLKEYCEALHESGETPPESWVRKGCPPTYPKAWRDRYWRERIQNEKDQFKFRLKRAIL